MSTPALSAFFGGDGAVGRDAVIDQFLHRAEIADDEAVEFPFLAQDFGQRKRVGRGGDAVERVERAHHRRRALRDGGVVGREINLTQGQLGHVDGVVFAARVGRAIGGEMFDARGDRVRLAQVVPW